MSQMDKEEKHENNSKEEEKPEEDERNYMVSKAKTFEASVNEGKHHTHPVKTYQIKSSQKSMVDSLVPHANEYEVLTDCGTGKYYHKILCQTNIAQNSNKFYISQVLVKNAKTSSKIESKEG